MNKKKFINFLLLRSAFTSRNFTSLLLVGLFFLVYVMAGGKISAPKIAPGERFGETAIPKASTVDVTGDVERSIFDNPSIVRDSAIYQRLVNGKKGRNGERPLFAGETQKNAPEATKDIATSASQRTETEGPGSEASRDLKSIMERLNRAGARRR